MEEQRTKLIIEKRLDGLAQLAERSELLKNSKDYRENVNALQEKYRSLTGHNYKGAK